MDIFSIYNKIIILINNYLDNYDFSDINLNFSYNNIDKYIFYKYNI